MEYDRFVGLVQNRARLATNGDAVAAIRATLTTLAERIDGGEAHDLAAQLPREIGYYLRANPTIHGERFSFREFCHRVADREYCDLPESVFHTRCVMEVLSEAVSPGELRDVRGQLPPDFQPLFEAGSMGRMRPREGRGSYRAGMPAAAGERWSERRAEERRQSWRDEPEGGWRRGGGPQWSEEQRERESGYRSRAGESRGRETGSQRGEYRGEAGRTGGGQDAGSREIAESRRGEWDEPNRGSSSRDRWSETSGRDSMSGEFEGRSGSRDRGAENWRSSESESGRQQEREHEERRQPASRGSRR